MHPDLRTAGSLPSLDMPHHLRSDEHCAYREGIAVEPTRQNDGTNATSVDCGLRRYISVPVELETGTRVTVKLSDESHAGQEQSMQGVPVSPDAPREEVGYFWGYSVRQASSLSNVFTECPFDGGYDLSIGTSERGLSLPVLLDHSSESRVEPSWTHLLLVFGGLAGLEAAVASDDELRSAGVSQARDVFDRWINLVPSQGSRTIRTEEAVWVGLTGLRPLVEERNAR